MLGVIEVQQEICISGDCHSYPDFDESFKYKFMIVRPVGEFAGLALAFC